MTTERLEGGAVLIRASGTLTKADYEACVPQLERSLAKEGKLRVLVVADELTGWTPSALWEDLKFDIRHHNDFERLGVVGDEQMLEWGATLTRPFFSGEIRSFDSSEMDEAMGWVRWRT